MDPPAWAQFKTHADVIEAINIQDPTFFEDLAAAFREAGLRNRQGPFYWFARATAPTAGASHAVVRDWPTTAEAATQTVVHETRDASTNTEPRATRLTVRSGARVEINPVEHRDYGTQTEARATTTTVSTQTRWIPDAHPKTPPSSPPASRAWAMGRYDDWYRFGDYPPLDDAPRATPSSRPAETLRPTPRFARSDRPRRGGCWNCNSGSHRYPMCPEPLGEFCYRCGYLNCTVQTCPQCTKRTASHSRERASTSRPY